MLENTFEATMYPRIAAGRFLIRFGEAVSSLAVAWMRPSDLMEFNRRHACVGARNDQSDRSRGADFNLTKEEIILLQKLPFSSARIILFGDGREEPALTCKGHDVTLADEGPLGLGSSAEKYNAAWLGGIFYAKIPGRARRIALLKRIASVLKPGGCLACQFLFDPQRRHSTVPVLFRRLFGFLTLGNFRLQTGDAIRAGREFSHIFSSWNEFQEEAQAAGFDIVFSQEPPAAVYGGAIARMIKSDKIC